MNRTDENYNNNEMPDAVLDALLDDVRAGEPDAQMVAEARSRGWARLQAAAAGPCWRWRERRPHESAAAVAAAAPAADCRPLLPAFAGFGPVKAAPGTSGQLLRCAAHHLPHRRCRWGASAERQARLRLQLSAHAVVAAAKAHLLLQLPHLIERRS